METVEAYVTSDGKIFSSKDEAENWESGKSQKKYKLKMNYTLKIETDIEALNEDEALEKAIDNWKKVISSNTEWLDTDFVDYTIEEVSE